MLNPAAAAVAAAAAARQHSVSTNNPLNIYSTHSIRSSKNKRAVYPRGARGVSLFSIFAVKNVNIIVSSSPPRLMCGHNTKAPARGSYAPSLKTFFLPLFRRHCSDSLSAIVSIPCFVVCFSQSLHSKNNTQSVVSFAAAAATLSNDSAIVLD